MKFKASKAPSDKETINYLDLTPKCILGHQIEPNGLVTLLVPRFESRFWKKFMNLPEKKSWFYLHLDELGSETWLQIDGEKPVRDICGNLRLKLGNKIEPAEERITRFLTQLYKNRHISFIELAATKEIK